MNEATGDLPSHDCSSNQKETRYRRYGIESCSEVGHVDDVERAVVVVKEQSDEPIGAVVEVVQNDVAVLEYIFHNVSFLTLYCSLRGPSQHDLAASICFAPHPSRWLAIQRPFALRLA